MEKGKEGLREGGIGIPRFLYESCAAEPDDNDDTELLMVVDGQGRQFLLKLGRVGPSPPLPFLLFPLPSAPSLPSLSPPSLLGLSLPP